MEDRKVLSIDEDEIIDRIQFRAKKIAANLELPTYSPWKWLQKMDECSKLKVPSFYSEIINKEG